MSESNYYQSQDLDWLLETMKEYALKGVQTKLVPTDLFGMKVHQLYIDIEDTHYKANNEARKREFGK